MKRLGYLIIFMALLAMPVVLDNPGLRASNEVTFKFRISGASKVKVYGSFNSWSKGYELKSSGADKWQQTVELTRGRYEYKFLVDGKWRYNTSLPSIDDGLYGRNNVIIVR